MFDAALKILNDKYPYWTTRVLNIGKPILTRSIPTACVALEKGASGDEFVFMFNPDFAASLTPDEMAFIMSHEAMHIVRNDLALWTDEYYSDKKTLNIAMDCIINDTLVNAGMTAHSTSCLGHKFDLGNCEGKTVREIYDALKKPDEPPSEGEGEGDGSGGTGDGEQEKGSGSGEPGDDGGGKPDGDASETDDREQNGWGDHSKWDDERMRDAAEPKSGVGEHAGTEALDGTAEGKPSERMDSLTADEIPSLDFLKLFSLMDPDMVSGFGLTYKTRPDWRKPRRNLTSLYPRVMLPSRRDNTNERMLGNKKPQIVIGIDVSSSVTSTDRSVFAAICRELPKDYAEYIFVCAASGAVEVSADDVFSGALSFPYLGGGDGNAYAHGASEWGKRGGKKGGANLPCVEFESMHQWIIEAIRSGRLRGYPKAVLMISDALSCLSSATFEQASRWLVLHNAGMDRYESPGSAKMRKTYSNIFRIRYGHPACRLLPKAFRHMREFVKETIEP